MSSRPTPSLPGEASVEQPIPTPPAAHEFAPSGRRVTGPAGRSYAICAVCGRKQIGLVHGPGRRPKQRLRLVEPPTTQAVGRRDASSSDVDLRPSVDRAGAPAGRATPMGRAVNPPTARPASPVRPEKAGAEMVALALALDTLLALPPDRVKWSLRLKAIDLRDAIPVAPIPTLQDATEPVEGAPSEVTLAALPQLNSRERPSVAGTVGPTAILRGIKSGRNRELIRRAIAEGWTARKTGGGHIALDHGSKRLIVSTTSDDRGHGWGNLRAEAKRAGLNVAGL